MISSNMKTKEVIEQLLHKFKIETSPNEFALYIIHASGEKKKTEEHRLSALGKTLTRPFRKHSKDVPHGQRSRRDQQ